MALSKSAGEILKLYSTHKEVYEQKEQMAYAKMQPVAAEVYKGLVELTDADKQHQDMEDLVSYVEQTLSIDRIRSFGDTAAAQADIINRLMHINNTLQSLGEDISGLRQLATGQIQFQSVSGNLEDYNIVSDNFFDNYIKKILSKIPFIMDGSVSNLIDETNKLKGELLEKKVFEVLKSKIPVEAYATDATMNIGPIDIFYSGKFQAVRSGGTKATSIPEDIIITFGDNSRSTLQSYLSRSDNKNSITLDIPAYDKIREQSFGISVKSAKGRVKFFSGNLDRFLSDDSAPNSTVSRYAKMVYSSYAKGERFDDSKYGTESVNKYIVARNLDLALGENNLFLADRHRFLTPMSKVIERLGKSMSSALRIYYSKGSTPTGAISG